MRRVAGMTTKGEPRIAPGSALDDVLGAAWNAAGSRTRAETLTALDRLAVLLAANAEHLAQQLVADTGLSWVQAHRELQDTVAACRSYAAHAPRWLPPAAHEVGVVVAVTPRSAPLWGVVRLALPVLVAGNSMVVTHADRVPATMTALTEVLIQARFPRGTFQWTASGPEHAEAIGRDERVAGVAFVAQGRGSAIPSGNPRAVIVSPGMDLDATAEAGALALGGEGQRPGTASAQFVVHRDIYGAFAQKLVEAVCSLVVGDHTEPGARVGALPTLADLDDVDRMVLDAVAQGARVLCSGMTARRPGHYYPPSVLGDVTASMELYRVRPRGPLALVLAADDLDHALDLSNGTSYALGAAMRAGTTATSTPSPRAALEAFRSPPPVSAQEGIWRIFWVDDPDTWSPG
jgi:succinate-semialdehyde dehydrogenase/glutarate-semialdehyde dehydrogenase